MVVEIEGKDMKESPTPTRFIQTIALHTHTEKENSLEVES